MTEPEILYRFTPPFEGAFLQGVPKRDLTQKDVNRMTGQERADAFTPHPVTGATLYTPTEEQAERIRVKAEASAAVVAAEEAERAAAEKAAEEEKKAAEAAAKKAAKEKKEGGTE